MRLIEPRTHKILSHMDRLQKFMKGEKVYPISVELDLSDTCDLKCSWCRFAGHHKSRIMAFELAKQILHELHNLGVKSIIYSGGGEPLLNANFTRIALVADRLGFDQGIYTNGTHIHHFKKTLRNKMKFVYISLDAATRETFLKTKKRDLFDQVLENIALLCEEEGGATIGLGFLIAPDNFHEIKKFMILSKKFDVDYIQFRPAVIETEQYRGWLPDILQSISVSDKILVADYKFRDLLREDAGRTYTRCLAHNFMGIIGADGTVWQCVNRRYQDGFDLGNLEGQSFVEIWGSERRKQVNKGVTPSECPKLCRGHELNKFLDSVLKLQEHPHKNFL